MPTAGGDHIKSFPIYLSEKNVSESFSIKEFKKAFVVPTFLLKVFILGFA